jgi:hypothetical protein
MLPTGKPKVNLRLCQPATPLLGGRLPQAPDVAPRHVRDGGVVLSRLCLSSSHFGVQDFVTDLFVPSGEGRDYAGSAFPVGSKPPMDDRAEIVTLVRNRKSSAAIENPVHESSSIRV